MEIYYLDIKNYSINLFKYFPTLASNLEERMSILNAYYFPDQDYSKFYPDISPVNTFRVILDQYFGTDLGLLEDRSYFSLMETPYDFIDVTEELSHHQLSIDQANIYEIF